MPDARPAPNDTREPEPRARERCGVVVIGHGCTASALVAAAQAIVPGSLEDVIALDAGAGRTPAFDAEVCAAIERADRGHGILLLVDLIGSSPCACGLKESAGHGFAMLTGLNLAMLAKLALLERDHATPRELAEACRDSASRSLCMRVHDAPEAGVCPATE